jgi:hypothetical protein
MTTRLERWILDQRLDQAFLNWHRLFMNIIRNKNCIFHSRQVYLSILASTESKKSHFSGISVASLVNTKQTKSTVYLLLLATVSFEETVEIYIGRNGRVRTTPPMENLHWNPQMVLLSHYVSNTSLLYFHVIAMSTIMGYMVYRLYDMGPSYFYKLTYWNWTFNVFYFIIASLQSVRTYKVYPQSQKLDLIQKYLFSITQPISLMVCLTYWVLLSGMIFAPDTLLQDRLTGIASHFFNLVFPLIELGLCKIVMEWYMVLVPLFVEALYFAVVLIWKSYTVPSQWPYDFMKVLDDEKGGIVWGYVAGMYVGIGLIIGMLFALIVLVIRYRDKSGAVSNKARV